MDSSTEVRVRFAPSPTGHWHIGGARTALFNWLFARKNGGKIILRIDDTDSARSEIQYETEIADILDWLGIDYDEGPEYQRVDGTWQMTGTKGEYGPYRQTERTDLYKTYLEELLENGKAYYCYCSKEELEAERIKLAAESQPPRYSGRCREQKNVPAGKSPQAIRFAVPEETVSFGDLVRGTVSFETKLFGDVIIAKSTTMPLYNFVNVVDDELMRISHVIRAEEHIANTPKQILIQRALKFKMPIYAHVPLILNPDRSKMSKRYAETSVLGYRDAGYLPEALINFLPLLGWHPKDDREIFSRDELIEAFDINRVQKAGAIFAEDKLNWMNREYLKKLSDDVLVGRVAPFFASAGKSVPSATLTKIVHLFRDRAATLGEFVTSAAFIFELPQYEPTLLIWKTDTAEKTKQVLAALENLFKELSSASYEAAKLFELVEPLMREHGRGSVLWPLRVAVSGLAASPDPMAIVEVLGPEETLRRITFAKQHLST